MEISGYNLRFGEEGCFIDWCTLEKKRDEYVWYYQTAKQVKARHAYKIILEQDGFFIPINHSISLPFKQSHFNITCKNLTYEIFLLYINAAFDYRRKIDNTCDYGRAPSIEYSNGKMIFNEGDPIV